MPETTHEALVRQTATAEELLSYFQGQRDQFNQDVADAQAAYGALAATLKAVVKDEMFATINFKPNEAAVDFSENGHIRNWDEYLQWVYQIPKGGYARLIMHEGTLEVTSNISVTFIGANDLRFEAAAGLATRPILKIMGYDNVTYNRIYSLNPGSYGSVSIFGCDLEVEVPANPAVPTANGMKAIISQSVPCSLHLQQCKVTCPAGFGLVQQTQGSHIDFASYLCEFDGPFVAVQKHGALGTARIGASNLTLSNGASLHAAGFTLGQDLIKS